ncbi:putative membrane protein [Nitrobacteraceae bacterium AZCC 2146]
MASLYPGNVSQFAQRTADAQTAPAIRTITSADLADALRLGWEDFKAVPSHAIMLCVIYPLVGLLLARTVLGYSILPLLFPLAAGFALIGPFAALGLYELSRRRELGDDASAWHAVDVLRSPSFGAMLGLGLALLVLFIVWIATAQAIYVSAFGNEPAAEIPNFVSKVLTTPQGWELIVVGCGVGFLFAVVALCISVVSFPLMLDRHANVMDAVTTSLRAVARNPVPMAMWGLIVAALLVLGSLPLFLGLAVVIPLLGHATWHLYRKVVERNPNPPVLPPRNKIKRSAADFPVSLFQWRNDK